MRRVKNLTLALVAAMALVAVSGASAASASYFEMESGVEGVSAKKTAGLNQVSLPNGYFGCNGVESLSGTETKLSTVKTSLGAVPSLGYCTVEGGFLTKPSVGSCEFILHAGRGQLLSGELELSCPGLPMRYEKGTCTATIGSQKLPLGSLDYVNSGSGSGRQITVSIHTSHLTYSTEGFCEGNGKGVWSNGAITSELTLTAHSSGGGARGIWVLQGPAERVFLAPEAPSQLEGQASSTMVLSMGTGRTLECGEAYYNGQASSVETTHVTAEPEYSNCKIMGWVGPAFTMGGCKYELSSTGGFSIVGTTCASNPITISFIGCTLKIGPQSGLSTVNLSDSTSGSLHRVLVENKVGGIKYTASGCPSLNGTFTNGALTGKFVLGELFIA